ncbi:MAG: hypothetical protein U0Y10_07795 [Spirosomataceae bacterium]
MKKRLIFFVVMLGFRPVLAIPTDSTAVSAESTAVKKPSVVVTGEIGLSTGFYSMTGLEPRAQFTPWSTSGKLTLQTTSGWTIPMTFVYSSQDNRFRQPYNQIGISALHKQDFKLHLGYRNVYFSPFTLAGHLFLGVGAEVQAGKIRLGVVSGKLNRAIESDYADPDRIPTFKRTGYSVRIGVGSPTNYFDVIFLKAADDLLSIDAESAAQRNVSAAENTVLGVSSRIKIAKKFTFELDGSASAYSKDIRAEVVDNKYASSLRLLFVPRINSQYFTAFQSAVGYQTKPFGIKLQYKRIEPDFRTMGAYYFQQDIESFTVAPTFKLFKKKLTLKTSIGVQHDNLLNQKKVQTNRLIGSAAMVFAPNENFSIDALYSNYGITQKAGYLPLIDTLRIAQNNRTLSLNGMYMRAGETTNHTFMATAIYQELQDLNQRTAALNENQNWNYNASYSFQHLIANVDLSLSYSYTLTKALDIETTYAGPSLSVAKRLLKEDRLSINTNLNYLRSHENIFGLEDQGHVLSTSLGIDFKIASKHTFSFNWNYLQSQGVQDFTEHRGSVGYQVSF